jgi:hypothetical protein
MKKFLALLLFSSLVMLPLLAYGNQATTIDELAAMYDSSKCADCHEDTHDEWKSSLHSQSVTDSRVIRVWRTFILSGMDKKGIPRSALKDICLNCHAPQVKDATPEVSAKIADLVVIAADDKDASKREAALKELGKLNVNCLVCHNMKAAEDGKPHAKTIYGPKDPADVPHKDEFGFDTVKTDYLKNVEFCAQCHHGCPPGMSSEKCPTQFTSYKEHYLAKGGDKTCQQCHMKGEDIASHKFPGLFDIEFAKTGLELTLNASPTEYAYHLENRIVPAVIVNTQLKNVAGHIIPHG